MIFVIHYINTGAAEPDMKGCTFAHQIFGLIVNKMVVLCTQNFALIIKCAHNIEQLPPIEAITMNKKLAD